MVSITDAPVGTGTLAGQLSVGDRVTGGGGGVSVTPDASQLSAASRIKDGVDGVSVTFGAGQLSVGDRVTDGVDTVTIDERAEGAIVPLGDFRRVEISLLDTAGDPLTSADQLVVEGPFPVSRPVSVDDGEASATAYLLQTEYSDARVTAQDDPALIYECVDGLPISPRDESAVLRFRPVSVGESGLHVTETRLG